MKQDTLTTEIVMDWWTAKTPQEQEVIHNRHRKNDERTLYILEHPEYLSKEPKTNKQKAELWWENTVSNLSERVQWKLSMVNKYYGNRPLARITPEMKLQMWLSENKKEEDKEIDMLEKQLWSEPTGAPTSNPFSNLFEQAAQISKSHAYDIVSKQRDELMEENKTLRERNKELEVINRELKEALKAFGY